MRSISQKVLIAVLVLVGIILLWWIGSAAYSGWQGYRWQKQTDAFQESLRRPYREDTFGGKTPEETWALFLSALRAGDVDLASKYFVVERQEEWREKLEESVRLERLESAVEKYSSGIIKDNTTSTSRDKAYYHVPVLNVNEDLEAYPVIFTLNTYTKIWKISIL